jgi:L-lactate utilization protein LutB
MEFEAHSVSVKKRISDEKTQEGVNALKGAWSDYDRRRRKNLDRNRELIREVKQIEEEAINRLHDLVTETVEALRKSGIRVITAKDSVECVEYMRGVVGREDISVVPSPQTTEADIIPAFYTSNDLSIASPEYRMCEMEGIAPIHPLFPYTLGVEKGLGKEIAMGLKKTKNLVVSGLVMGKDGIVYLDEQESGAVEAAKDAMVFLLITVDRLAESDKDARSIAKLMEMASGGLIKPRKFQLRAGLHVILLDNGRLPIALSSLKEALRCIHCHSCSLYCPVFSSVGGSFGSPNAAGIGIIAAGWGQGIKTGVNRGLYYCILCKRCVEECPMGIPIPEIIRGMRRKAHISGL